MSEKPENPQAFPSAIVYAEPGMTLRDYFATAALQAIAHAPDATHAYDTAERAYRFADAMLKARSV